MHFYTVIIRVLVYTRKICRYVLCNFRFLADGNKWVYNKCSEGDLYQKKKVRVEIERKIASVNQFFVALHAEQ